MKSPMVWLRSASRSLTNEVKFCDYVVMIIAIVEGLKSLNFS
jgi:hypothetical protein